MTKAIERLSLLKTSRSRAETKAEVTDSAARTIVATEAAKRDAKTAKLRQARLAREALQVDAPPEKRGSRKPAKKKA
ncbi:hypothetical protein [Kumtagia ephedrae]|jgi:hypothetical protein|uniref:Uncharacterized protein n=1 Tax=Kumtagia ephedrae TaxID=2116701 RepID=A0A2P7S6G8_9HYPH|nr:hypothetical protein [Mesorhizobium ephedrae]PSJ58027.1 hypothetical protein C7I84_16310 [Mesorhizobium ephedrae]